MTEKTYRDLVVWQKAMDLAAEVYSATRAFPDEERFGLVSQMRRSAVSIPSNIAEGQSRGTSKDFARFLWIARGSLSELETQSVLAHRVGFLTPDAQKELENRQAEVSRLLFGLLRKIEPDRWSQNS